MKYVYLDQIQYYANSAVKDTGTFNTYDLGKEHNWLFHNRLNGMVMGEANPAAG